MGRLFKILIGCVFILSLSSYEREKKFYADLIVECEGIRNLDGNLYIFLYNYENQYHENPYLNFTIDKRMVTSSGKLTYRIPNLEYGKYAISLLDDENSNEDLDMFLGVPTEGYGFSNNVKPFFALPDYDELLFDINSKKKTIKLTLQYIL